MTESDFYDFFNYVYKTYHQYLPNELECLKFNRYLTWISILSPSFIDTKKDIEHFDIDALIDDIENNTEYVMEETQERIKRAIKE